MTPNPTSRPRPPKQPLRKAEESYDDEGYPIEPVSYYSTAQGQAYRFFLDEDIQAPRKYRPLVQVLLSAQPGDVIELYINTNGGILASAEEIIEGIRGCQGHVHGIICTAAYSAGGMIALACHSLTVLSLSTFMAHEPSGGVVGKHSDSKEEIAFLDKRFKGMLLQCYEGFFTPVEIKDMLGGKTFWLLADEIEARLEARIKYFEAKQAEKQQEVLEETLSILGEPTPKPLKKTRKAAKVSVPEDKPSITKENL